MEGPPAAPLSEPLPNDQVSRVKLDLIEYVDKRIVESTTRDRDFIKFSLTFTLGIVGTVITLAAALLAVFGIKTLGDIEHKVKELTESSINQQIVDADPKGALHKGLENILIQSLIDMLNSDSSFITVEDIDQVLEYMFRDETDETMFNSGLRSIVRHRPQVTKNLSDKLIKYLESHSTSYSRLSQDSSKIESVIDTLTELRYPYAIPTVRKWIGDADAATKVRIAAVNYAAAIVDQESLPSITNLVRSSDQDIRRAALSAIAIIDPGSSELSAWFEKLGVVDNADKIQDADAVFKTLCSGQNEYEGSIFDTDEGKRLVERGGRLWQFSFVDPAARHGRVAEDAVRKRIKEILKVMLNSGLTFKIDRQLSYTSPDRVIVNGPNAVRTNGGGFGSERTDLGAFVVHSTPFSECRREAVEIMADAAKEGDRQELMKSVRFLTVEDFKSEQPWVVPFLTLTDDVTILLQDGNSLSNKIISAAVLRIGVAGFLDVGFLRAGGDRAWAQVKEFQNLEKAQFSLGFRQEGIYFSRD